LRKQVQAKPQINKWKEIIKFRIESNEIETEKMIQRINETKSWLFEKANKIDKPSATLTKRKRKTQNNKTRDDTITNTNDIFR
jgi:hypothetical protein